MKILLINNYHFKKGGAEKAYFDTAKILESHGHSVAFFSTKNPNNEKTEWEKFFVDNVDYENKHFSLWQKMKIVQKIIFNFEAKQNLEKLIADFQPDVAHLHNIYHQLSPSIIFALKKNNIPIVMTLHDYKLISPNYSLFLNGKIWEKKPLFFCIKDKCVKNSYFKSLVCVLEKIINDFLGSYKKVDVFVSPSKFLIKKFSEFGFLGKIEYIPNPIELSFSDSKSLDCKNGPLVYYGRLSKEKGVDVAVRALKLLDEKENLLIVGEGPEKENLVKLVEKLNLNSRIRFVGFKSGQELENVLQKAKAITIPSVWYENMPYTSIESMALGKIVIASEIGGMADLIIDGKNGFLFEPNSSQELAEKIKNLKKYNLEEIENNAKKSVANLNFESYYKNIINVFENLNQV